MQYFYKRSVRERESKINVNINQNKTMNLILNLCSSNRIAFPGKKLQTAKGTFFHWPFLY